MKFSLMFISFFALSPFTIDVVSSTKDPRLPQMKERRAQNKFGSRNPELTIRRKPLMSTIVHSERDKHLKIHNGHPRKKLSKSVYRSKPVKKLTRRPPKRQIPESKPPTKFIKEKQLLLAPPGPPLGPRLPFRLSPAALLVPTIPTLVGELEN